ncbi:MAG: SIS domain-containing protein [Candidatus Ranarchaeia archaeon]
MPVPIKLTAFCDFLLGAIGNNIQQADDEQIDQMADLIVRTNARDGRLLIVGAGRTGLVGKSFGMRLYHLGFNVSIVGETIVPRARNTDTLIALSGSGKTTFTVDSARAAKKVGSSVIAITSNRKSPLAELADLVVIIKGKTKTDIPPNNFSYTERQLEGFHQALSPLGSMFELTCYVFLEGMIAILMNRLGLQEEDLRRRHTNIE